MTLWSRFTSWISGWPEGAKERIQNAGKEEVKEELPKKKTKKPKGLNPKKKKGRARKQGNISQRKTMASILDIRRMGTILERKSRGRIWNNDFKSSQSSSNKKRKKVQHEHIHHNWDKDLWD